MIRRLPAAGFIFATLTYIHSAAAAPMTTADGTPIAWKKGFTLETVSDDINIDEHQLATVIDEAMRAWTKGVQDGPALTVEPSKDKTVQNSREVHRALVISDAWPGDDSALAVTTYTFRKSTGEIVDADIIVNGTGPCLSLDAKLREGCYDLRGVLVHETGHFLGLDHDPDAASVMFPTLAAGDDSKRAPTEEDFENLAESYGGLAVEGAASRSEATLMLVPVARDGCSQTGANASSLMILLAFLLRVRARTR